MNFQQVIIVAVIFLWLTALLIGSYIQSTKIAENSSAIAVIRSTIAQQPQAGNLFSDSTECITGFSYYDSDTSIFFNNGYHRLVITHDYRKQTSSVR